MEASNINLPIACFLNSLLIVEDKDTIIKKLTSNPSINFHCDNIHLLNIYDTECLVCYDHILNTLYITFKWTEEDEISDVSAHLLIKAINVDGIGTIHSGYYNKYKAVEKELLKIVDHYTKKNPSILVTGHSLGGAIASITYLGLISHLQNQKNGNIYSNNIICITTGSCRSIKNTMLADDAIKCYNFINFEDYVTLYPFNYKHLGETFLIKNKGKIVVKNIGYLQKFRLCTCFIIEQIRNFFMKGNFFLIPDAHYLSEYEKVAETVISQIYS
ncbi:Class 3 lipase family protein [Candidatus Cyrtobacter comes]|uniref:Class 3 lipase family protein n=1 Tax=Candidatus Cyrtobacter comes TaxID=675776 RepID=A0ABU5L724_9RICK|nr:lipase family protein [Candidatus Cyrtobacter comes]MDZ5761924.1 Class 3 lipase family protein [Candidatus Cyrtobacter comes]